MIQDNPARVAGALELESDKPYADPLDREPTEDACVTAPAAIASIALSLPEKPTSADVLFALRRAYDQGWAIGWKSGCDGSARLMNTTMDMIDKALIR